MDSTLHDLGGILLKAVPTLILLLILNVYLKAVFFKPLQEVLRKRREMTEGAREAAEASLKKADERVAQYETKLKEARTEIYREQEQMRRRWVDEQSRQIEGARHKTHELIMAERQKLAEETAASKAELRTYAVTLGEQIASTLLQRRPS